LIAGARRQIVHAMPARPRSAVIRAEVIMPGPAMIICCSPNVLSDGFTTEIYRA